MGILKIPGLASGLDTDNLIKTLMQIEQRPVIALQKKTSDMTTEANAWRDLNQRLLTLQKRVEELKNLTASDWQAQKSSVSDGTVLGVTSVTSTAAVGSYSVEVVSLATATSILSGPMSDGVAPDPDLIDSADKDLGIQGVIKIASGPTAGKTFTVSATDSLNDIVKTINNNSADLGVTASVMQVAPGDYRLVLKGKNGTANDFTLDDGDADMAATKLGLKDGLATKTAGTNGSLKVNGTAITISDNVVKDAIGGTTLTLTKVGTTTVTVSKDYSKAANAVKAVVDQYNSVMDLMGTQTAYDADKKTAGPLFGNNRVRDIQSAIRTRLFDSVDGLPDEFKSLGIVGVGAEPFKAGEKSSNKLTFDLDKFNKAMDKDPVKLRQMFVQEGSKTSEQGVAVRLASYLDNYTRTDGILAGEAKALDKSIELVNKRITWYTEQELPAKEAQLRQQFLNLEKAMSTFQNQGNWLSGQIKSLGSNS